VTIKRLKKQRTKNQSETTTRQTQSKRTGKRRQTEGEDQATTGQTESRHKAHRKGNTQERNKRKHKGRQRRRRQTESTHKADTEETQQGTGSKHWQTHLQSKHVEHRVRPHTSSLELRINRQSAEGWRGGEGRGKKKVCLHWLFSLRICMQRFSSFSPLPLRLPLPLPRPHLLLILLLFFIFLFFPSLTSPLSFFIFRFFFI